MRLRRQSWEDLSALPHYPERRLDLRLLQTWTKPLICLFLFLVVMGAQAGDYPGAESVRRFTSYAFSTHKDLTPYLQKIGERLIQGDPVQPAASQQQPAETQKPMTTMQLIYPVAAGKVISQSRPENQYALSIQTQPGQLVRASQAGRVAAVTGDQVAGYTIQIDHGNGFISVLGSCTEVWVKPDDEVQTAQTIGRLSRLENSPLLTYRLTYRGQPVDPLAYINAGN